MASSLWGPGKNGMWWFEREWLPPGSHLGKCLVPIEGTVWEALEGIASLERVDFEVSKGHVKHWVSFTSYGSECNYFSSITHVTMVPTVTMME